MGMTLYFTSVSEDEQLQYLSDNNVCNILVSYLDKGKILKLINKNISNLNLFVDSGAFSAYTRGIEINIDDYISFLNSYHDKFVMYASLDVIPDSDSLESVKETSQKTLDNFNYMYERLIDKDKLLYTFHCGEDYNFLTTVLKMTHNGEFIVKRLALGGIAKQSMAQRIAFISKCYKIINDLNRKDVTIHLFGVTDMSVCKEFGCNSADSTTWVRAASFGEICTDYGRLIVSGNRPLDNLYTGSLHIKEICEKNISESGFTLEELSQDSHKRELYNIQYFLKQASLVPEPQFIPQSEKLDLW